MSITYAAAQFEEKDGKLHLTKKTLGDPKPDEVVLKVEACGVCAGDTHVCHGAFGVQFPRVPGHEVVGTVVKVGSDVTHIKVGQRLGVGWHGGHCSTCDRCQRGDFIMCRKHRITGFAHDGGYAEYITVPANTTAVVPDELKSKEAAPLMCAGVTVYNSLRHLDAMPGDLVAVQGLGGLGHLAVQYAHKMGFVVAAISSGSDKAELAKKLGADLYIDASKESVVEELQKRGGARVIMATVPSGKAMSSVIGGLGIDGVLLVLGASLEPITVPPVAMIGRRLSIKAWPSGSPIDSQDALYFAAKTGIRPMIEVFPLEKASEAYDRMASGKAMFRVVIKP